MVSHHRQQVRDALAAVTVLDPMSYAWFGRRSRRPPPIVERELDCAGRRNFLVSSIKEELYRSFYCSGGPVPARWGQPEPAWAEPRLVEALSEANTGTGSREAGWTFERVVDGFATVTSPKLRFRIPLSECRAIGGGCLVPGAEVSVPLPKELHSYSPGFHTIVSEAAVTPAPAGIVIRVYWHITRAGAPALVGALTSRLNAARMPFRLKVADHPYRLERCDAAVLYLEADAYAGLGEVLDEAISALGTHLQPQVPAFTAELAPGVGLAEDDGSAESFGISRCALLADGIVRAHEKRIVSPDARLDVIAQRFAEERVEIDAPYREPSLSGRHVL